MTISAKIIADSIGENSQVRITTFELEYPRFIHSEFMTHRLFSRNAQSSRAVPVGALIEQIKSNPAMPIHWGKNQPGMQAKEECNEAVVDPHVGGTIDRLNGWTGACLEAILYAQAFHNAGYHKQIVNRLLEPFAHIKVVCTATEYDNFFWLRNHPDAQPEIKALAEQMLEARYKSEPVILNPGDWHVPYYDRGFVIQPNEEQLKEALMVSSSCCAQVSYRKLDDSLEKAQMVFQRLIEAKPVHASPFEHQATPMGDLIDDETVEKGVTHIDMNDQAWSGNFREWIQHRQLIDDHVCWNYAKTQLVSGH